MGHIYLQRRCFQGIFFENVWLFLGNYAIIIINIVGGKNNARVTNVFIAISFTIV